jgi:hypothetical protein
MDPISLAAAAATTIVNLLATDAWGKAKEKVGALWRRFHPEQADAVEAELAQAHDEVRGGDETAVRAQALYWESRLLRLMSADAAVAAELARVVDELRADSPSTYTVSQRAKATGRSTVIQVGRDAQIGEKPLTAGDEDREAVR